MVKGVFIRSYDKEAGDITRMKNHYYETLKTENWEHIVKVKKKLRVSLLFSKTPGVVNGIFISFTDEHNTTFVNIYGKIDFQKLGILFGKILESAPEIMKDLKFDGKFGSKNKSVLPVTPETTQNKIYWIEQSSASIRSANLDGSNVQNIMSNSENGKNTLFDIALDVSGGKIYWTDYQKHRIQSANLDGTNVKTLINDKSFDPRGIALDVSGGKMYWTDYQRRRIQSANLDGTNVKTLVPELNGPVGIALDVTNEVTSQRVNR